MLIDSHCHLNMLDLSDYPDGLDQLVKETIESGVDRMLCIGVDLAHAQEVIDIAERYPQVFASVGVHPSEKTDHGVSVKKLCELADHPKVVGIGETGLDYHYNDEATHASQQLAFRHHITAAKELNKPLIIHSRDAREDTIRIMQEEKASEASGVMHCFTESWEMAQAAMEQGFYISISGIVTFKKAENVVEVARQVPLDRLLVETDAPYLAPVPFRGKPNQPKYVRHVAEFLADLRGISFEELCQITSDNFLRLFAKAS